MWQIHLTLYDVFRLQYQKSQATVSKLLERQHEEVLVQSRKPELI